MKHPQLAVALVSLTVLLGSIPPTHSREISALTQGDMSIVRDGDLLMGGPASGFHDKADTVYVLGGPGSLTGKFQDAAGLPDWQGWTGLDLSVGPQSQWHIDTYNCANLDSTTVDNHAWWCGRYFDACDEGDDPGGYGDSWEMSLEWSRPVADANDTTVVIIQAVLNCDLESGYDYIYLQAHKSDGWSDLVSRTGTELGLAIDESHSLYPADYTGPQNDEIRLRWLVVTDNLYSDEDCRHTTRGAAQIDRIRVSFGDSLVSDEGCEPGEEHDWIATPVVGVGDYAALYSGLDDLDECATNLSPQVAFVAHATTGLPTYQGTSWQYGPDETIVHPEGGLAGPDYHLKNYIVSPPLPWPGPGYSGAILEFDVYRHENMIENVSPGMFYKYLVRSTTNSDPAALSDANWRRDGNLHYGGPDYTRHKMDLTTKLEPAPQWFQVALGVDEAGFMWGITGTQGTPAPYFDNVSVKVFPLGGPAMSAKEIELANDGFPASGMLELGNLAGNSVRFDMARSRNTVYRVPGDSVVVEIAAVRPGSGLAGSPEIHWTMKANPLFDPYRTSGYATSGSEPGQLTYSSAGVLQKNRWNFDLPDEDFLFPGDVLHYFFRAADDLGGVSILPADTTGFGDFTDPNHRYDASFTVHALPSLHSSSPGDQPPILLWNDYGNRGGEDEWFTALDNLGYREGTDYDVYYTNAPSSDLGNGLGNAARLPQIAGYGTLLYTAGDLANFTLVGPKFTGWRGDRDLLDAWLTQGNKNALFTGDNLASDIFEIQGQTSFLNSWLPLTFDSRDIGSLGGGILYCEASAGNPVFPEGEGWSADRSCPDYNTFDAVQANSPSQGIAEFLYTSYDAAVLHADTTSGSRVIYTPYDLMYVAGGHTDKAPVPSAERTVFLESVLSYFGVAAGGGEARVPSLVLSSVAMPPATGFVSIQASPLGSGDRLDAAQLWDGQPGSPVSQTDATITVTLRDSTGAPVAGYPAEDLWLTAVTGTFVRTAGMAVADRPTDSAGITTFSGTVACGGWADSLRVVVAGSPLVHDPLPVLVNSTDLSGDLRVSLSDHALFRSLMLGGYDRAADFHRDGVLDILDLIRFVRTDGEVAP